MLSLYCTTHQKAAVEMQICDFKQAPSIIKFMVLVLERPLAALAAQLKREQVKESR